MVQEHFLRNSNYPNHKYTSQSGTLPASVLLVLLSSILSSVPSVVVVVRQRCVSVLHSGIP